MNNRKIIAKRLKKLRQKKKKTQKDLSQEIGIPINTIIAYENARRLPDFNSIVKLENYFGISISYLNGNDEECSSKEEIEEGFTQVDLPTEYLINRLCVLNNDLISKKETLKNMKIHNEFSGSGHHYMTFLLEKEIEELEIVVNRLEKALE